MVDTYVASSTPKIGADDWRFAKLVGVTFNIDPLILLAIGLHETGWGTKGDGRPPPGHHGHTLGVGSFDSGSTDKYAGSRMQMVQAGYLLRKNGVRTFADIQSGKLHVTSDGRVRWASADTAANGYPWSTAVVRIGTQLRASGVKTSSQTSAWPGTNADIERANLDIDVASRGKPPSGIGDAVKGGIGVAGDVAGGAVGAVTGIGDLIGWIMNPMNILRVLEVIGGIAALILGFIILARGTIVSSVGGAAVAAAGGKA